MASIRTKIIAIIALCVLLVSLSIGGLAIVKSNKALTDGAKNELGLLADDAANQILLANLRIQTAVDDMDTVVATTIDLERTSDPKYMEAYLAELDPKIKAFGERTYSSLGSYVYFKPEEFGKVHYIWYASEDGVFSATEDGTINETGYLMMDSPDFSESEDFIWYYKPMKAQKGVWTEIYYDVDLQYNSISYVKPIYVDGKIIGMTGMDMSFDETKKTIENVKVYNNGFVFLLDGHNEFIVEPKHELPEGLVQTVASDAAKRGIFEYQDLFVTYNKLDNDQTVVVVAPKEEVLAPINSLTMQFILIAAVIAIVMLGIGLYLVNRISARILKLKEAADKITNGDFNVELPPAKENDELSGLTASLEMLVAGFKAKKK